MKLGICSRCINGQTIWENYNESCKECSRTGATVCRNCLVHWERKCIQCGYMNTEFTVRREQLSEVNFG